MTRLSDNQTPRRRGRLFPERQISPEEKERRRLEDENFSKRCRVIFDLIKPELIEEHYNWFIAIEPVSGEYFIDKNQEIAIVKAKEKYPDRRRLILRLNETGACGRI